MNIRSAFEEILKLLVDEETRFLIVGGYAVAFHGYVRATNDIDILFDPTVENATRIQKALAGYGIDIEETDLLEPGGIFRVGVPPLRIELINTISGVTFEEAWGRRIIDEYGDTRVAFISRKDLLSNKRAAGRPKDLNDFDQLGGNR